MTVKELIQQLEGLQKLSNQKDLPVKVTDTNQAETSPVYDAYFDSDDKDDCVYLVLRGVRLHLEISDEV